MKTVLLAVCGLAPQVITETLYALHQQGQQVDAVRVLSTRPGKDACIAGLLRAGDGHYFQYMKDYDLGTDGIDFAPRQLRAALAADGTELEDIASEDDSERFLKLCMEETFELTRDPQHRVLFSIAGGRKTMGACLSIAAQCYARPQDRLYHVLVSPAEFENCRDFYYPPPQPRMIEVRTPTGRPCHMSTEQAQITLVPMPFFPLREQLTPRMLEHPESPAALMLSLVREARQQLVVDLSQQKIVWKGVELDLPPALLALYALLALHKQEADCTNQRCQGCATCFLSVEQILARQTEMTRLYQRLTTREPVKSGATALDGDYFKSYRAKINRAISTRFGQYEARHLHLSSHGPRLATRYGIGIDRDVIRVVL